MYKKKLFDHIIIEIQNFQHLAWML